ncbi:MAG: TetR family transcriptional regulator C-terminal domain-containing protein [Rhodobacteraceae bacterium]|nr:TetR family transcriptional regulator C-terminal domain-containing protein [Paracoccaceae bacterium]
MKRARKAKDPGDGKGLSRIQEKNRRRINAAALSQFAQYGYSGTTIDMIAGAAGMSKSNLLYYYASKATIYQSVLSYILDEWLAPLRGMNPDGEPGAELAAYIHHKIKMSSEFPQASKLFANEVMQGAPRIKRVLEVELKQLVDQKAAVIQGWVDSGKIDPIDPVHLIFTIWGMTQHYADFDTQVRALTGKSIENKRFCADAEAMVTHLVLKGIGLTPPQELSPPKDQTPSQHPSERKERSSAAELTS